MANYKNLCYNNENVNTFSTDSSDLTITTEAKNHKHKQEHPQNDDPKYKVFPEFPFITKGIHSIIYNFYKQTASCECINCM